MQEMVLRNLKRISVLAVAQMHLFRFRVTPAIPVRWKSENGSTPLAGHAATAAIAAALPGNDGPWSIDPGDKPISEEAAILLADGLRGNRSVQQLRMNASAVSDATRQRLAKGLAANRRG